ncbi:MAG: hypothetical protein J6P40_05930 [Oscillospiraceae bacterium]|nr:hypothetical protein [Oscillospiraceae bacterium]
MDTAIQVALITGTFGLIGSVLVAVISAVTTKTAVTHKLETAQAVTDTKIEELTREVRKHNNFAERIPVMEEQIKVANHRIDDLEKKG